MAQIHAREIGAAEGDLVHQFLMKSFGARSSAEQRFIVQQPRPRPSLNLKTRDRVFQDGWYDKKDWLCGSQGRKALFCWPCLLFRPGISRSWTVTGYTNMHSILSDSRKHIKSNSHMESYKIWKTFDLHERVDVQLSRARREEINRHNEEVRQNRELLKTIIEAAIYLSKQELAFRGNDESNTSLNRGNYRELLECFSKFDSVFERRLHRKLAENERSHLSVFTGVSPEIQNDLIDCINSVIDDQVRREIMDCTFISIQADETTDVSTKEQLSFIFRFDRKGDIVERFIKFANVSSDRTALAISDLIRDLLNGFGESLTQKLVMQTYDGATVMSGHVGGVQTILQQDYPYAYFFHCAAHRLNLVLSQSASSISVVKVFFANVSAFSNFTGLSSKRKEHLSSKGIEIPHPSETRWHYRSRIINQIFHRYHILQVALEEITEHPHSWDDMTISQADGLLQYLESFRFCFLIVVFQKIFEQSTILYSILQNKTSDFSLGVEKIENFVLFLQTSRDDAVFHELYASTEALVGSPVSRSDKRQNYKQLYFEVIDATISMMQERFQDCRNFAFLDLVNPNLFSQWKDKVPTDLLSLLQLKYGPLFNMNMLESQLIFIYRDGDFYKESSAEVLDYIYSVHLETSLPEAVKLLKLNASITISSASVERSFSYLRRVKTHLRGKMGQERLSSLCRIAINKDILKEMEDMNILHSLVIDKFVQKPRRLNFHFK